MEREHHLRCPIKGCSWSRVIPDHPVDSLKAMEQVKTDFIQHLMRKHTVKETVEALVSWALTFSVVKAKQKQGTA